MSQRSSVRFSHYAFFTLTYGDTSNVPPVFRWGKITSHYNRFIQKLRRLHNTEIQAIRSIESHASGNPHIHVLVRFGNPLTINNEKYFDRLLYHKWKQLWKGGYLDCTPTHGGGKLPIRYLLKYISKHTTTYKTLWRNYYKCQQQDKLASETTSTKAKSTTQLNSDTPMVELDDTISPKELSTILFCQSFKIKSLSWTRAFFPREQLSSPPAGKQTSL